MRKENRNMATGGSDKEMKTTGQKNKNKNNNKNKGGGPTQKKKQRLIFLGTFKYWAVIF